MIVVPGLFAQTSGYLGNYTQPAPNVASLGKYVDYPIGYYTGTPEISVPIYELHDGAAKLPISLSYHASGIRVSELASWVGLGWSLNATGMIMRTVRGGPDEGMAVDHVKPGGYYLDSGVTKFLRLPYPVNGIIPTNDSNTSIQSTFQFYCGGGKFDGEPDLFTFNVNGYGGKFVFDEHRQPHLLGQQDIKISVNYTLSDGFASWLITTPDGTDYYFGENGMHEMTTLYNNGVYDPNSNIPSSWYLTKIVYPNTKDTVLFNYTPEKYWYYDLGSESALFNQINGVYSPTGACIAESQPPTTVYKSTVSGLRLTSIQSRNYTISFIAKTIRQDVASSSAYPRPYSLDSIKIFTAGNQCISQFSLSHTYFTSTTSGTKASAGALGQLEGDVSDTKRLKLTTVQEFSGDASLSKPAYSFTYQETLQLPRRISYDQDHWGFSNYYAGTRNDRFTPSVSHSICNTSGGEGLTAYRDAHWPDMQSFTIKSITDPLGVVTSFEFENHVSDMGYVAGVVGGLRIHKIETLDNVTGKINTRLYEYGKGVVYHAPKYLIDLHNEYFVSYNWPTSTAYVGYDFNEFNLMRGLLRMSQSVVPLQDFQGNHIGYYSVKEIFGPHGEGGYKVRSFMADQMKNDCRLDIYNFLTLATIQNGDFMGQGPGSGLWGNGHWNDILPQNLAYHSSYDEKYYPFAPQQVDFRRGQLLREETYDSNGVIIQSVINRYQETYCDTLWLRGFKFYRFQAPMSNADVYHYDPLYNNAYTFFKLRTGISHLVETITENYKDNKKFITDARYGYESQYHTQKTADTTVNSLGDSLISKTYYTLDYANTATSDNVFTKLKARNMVLPVSQRLWKNKKLMSGTITQFKDFASSSSDTIINPQKIYSLDVSSTLTTTQANENIKLTGLLPTLVPNTWFTEKAMFNYDGSTGDITEQNLTYDKTQALIWDKTLSLPLAVVDNAKQVDIAYNSFESAETGNWTYTASQVTMDASAPTGRNVYTLDGTLKLRKAGLTASKKYILSYWMKTGSSVTITGASQSNSITGSTVNTNWTYKQVTLTTSGTTVDIKGTGYVDEVRIYPATAQMVSYTYDSLFRLMNQCSANSTISRYEYDSFNRLVDIKDQFGNVLKAFEYNYGGLSR